MRVTVFLSICVILFSCEKSTLTVNTSQQSTYFPISVGRWMEYDVTVVNIDVASDKFDTIRYTLREETTSLLDSSQYEQSYRITRTVLFEGKHDWETFDAVMLTVTPHQIIWQENNSPYLKLVYPVQLNSHWNGNAFNTSDSIDWYISEISGIGVYADQELDSIVTVTQSDFVSAINIDQSHERYAPNVGLVYKEQFTARSNEIIFDDNGVPLPVADRVDIGVFYIQRIKVFGDN